MPLKLHVVKGKEPGRIIAVPDEGSVVIGRKNADACLDDQLLSRQHVRVELKAGEATITDLGSSNGTFLNGDKIAQSRLSNGDAIKIGAHVMHVEYAFVNAGAEGSAAAARGGLEALAAARPLKRRELVFCTECYRAVPREQSKEDMRGIRCLDCVEGGGFDPGMIDGFKLVERIAEGRLGPIYKAKHLTLQKYVLMKVIRSDQAVDEQALRRFARQAKIGGRLHHPNIAAMYDAAESNGHFYICLEYNEGESLEERLKREHRLPSSEVVRIGGRVADALRHAWDSAKIIHRNIKPSNIFLTAKGEVKLGDFGLAKSLDPAAAVDDATPVNEPWGTLHYMSPEQLEGIASVDTRTDIYALGATLYQAITGDRPFDTGSIGRSIEKIRNGVLEPADKVVGKGCPRGLGAAIARAMDRDKARRFQTPGELLQALQALGG